MVGDPEPNIKINFVSLLDMTDTYSAPEKTWIGKSTTATVTFRSTINTFNSSDL